MRHIILRGEVCLLLSMQYVNILICLFIGMTRFTVQSKIVYEVKLFAMPAMQCVIYALEYKVFALVSAATNHCLLHAYCHA